MRTSTLLFAALALATAHAQEKKEDTKPAPGKFPEFTGRVEATAAEIRPRVSGHLTNLAVREGESVKVGELLAEIDPRPYKAQLDLAKAQVALEEAQLKLAKMNHIRAKRVADLGGGTKDELEKAEAELEVANARLMAAKASLEVAAVNLGYTKITAPIEGRIGRFHQTVGNIVVADTGLIATIVRTDPLRVSFDVDEKTITRLQDAIADGRVKAGKLAAAVGFAEEDGFPHLLTVDFIDNQFAVKTGTLQFGAKLPNPKGTIFPGMSVRVRLTLAK